MRSTFWGNRIFERQSSQNRHTGLKFSSKRENSALSMKIVQNALFRSCAGQRSVLAKHLAFLSVKVLSKSSHWPANSRQNGKTVRFPWKLYKTLFSGHAQHVLAKSHFWSVKFSKSSHWPQILFKTGKQCAFHKNCTKRSFRSCGARFGQIAFLSVKVLKIVKLASNSLQKGKTVRFPWKLYKTLFQVMRSTFWPNRIFERQISQNRYACLKFSLKGENSALSMKIVQNATFQVMRSTFWPNRIFKRQSSQNDHTCLKFSPKRKTVRFPWKLYKTLFSGHAQHVLAKSHFWASKL